MTADRRARGWLALVAFGASGCVNTYVVDPPGVGSSGEPDADTSATGELGSSGSEGATAGADSGGTGGATGSTGVPPDSTGATGSTGDGNETGAPEVCQPCTADDQCGGEFDLCVALDAEPVCLRVCVEGPRMCPFETTCMPVTSVDGVDAQQCVPDSGTCMEADREGRDVRK